MTVQEFVNIDKDLQTVQDISDVNIIHANPRETKSGRKDAKWCILLHFGYKICLVKTLNRRFATSW